MYVSGSNSTYDVSFYLQHKAGLLGKKYDISTDPNSRDKTKEVTEDKTRLTRDTYESSIKNDPKLDKNNQSDAKLNLRAETTL